MNKIICTLDPHRLGDGLDLSQGNLVVTTTAVESFQRAVFGTIALGVGDASFEGFVYSQSRPSAGLVDLFGIGIAEVGAALDQTIGEETELTTAALPMSWAYRPFCVDSGGHFGGIFAGGNLLTRLQAGTERDCISVFFYGDISAPKVSWSANGNYLGQADLSPGRFYLPAVSIGSAASPNDVAAYVNFGQRGLNYPNLAIKI